MMRSLFAGVSGLQNHQIRMDVIGNNISNVNTIGFKKGRVTFQDLFSQYLDSAAGPNEKRGGINPKQVGLGVTTASIDTIFNAGSLQNTGVKSDVAIAGNGFFVLRNGTENLFTRAGAFDIDAEGWLVNPANGMRVQGWNAETDGTNIFVNQTGAIEDLRVPIQAKDPAKSTTQVLMRSNLDKNTPILGPDATEEEIRNATWTVEQDIYDSFGNIHVLQMNFTREVGVANQWRVNTVIDPNAIELTIATSSIAGVDSVDGSFLISFDNNGLLQSVTNDAGGLDENEGLVVNFAMEVADTNPVLNEAGIEEAQIQNFAVNIGDVGVYTDSVTQFASASSSKVYLQDGYTMGYLKDFNIDRSGNIIGSYSNQQKRIIGQIALATFPNSEGLEKTGETNFTTTINSGYANIGEAGTLDRGTILAGKLEMSNVDLAEDFTDMIVTQRGFQANSRTIRTADQMIQELLTLKQ